MIKIKRYIDIKILAKNSVKENFMVDLGELPIKEKQRAIDFLSGLTFFNGSIKKTDKDQYLITMTDKKKQPLVHKNPNYEYLDEKVKKGIEQKKKFDSHKLYPSHIPSEKVLAEYNVQTDSDKISYITMDTFNHIIVLTKDKKLYIDNVLYKEGVKKIIEFTKTNLIFIFENNEVERYSNQTGIIKECKKYDKVLYTDSFLATLNLKEKYLYVYYIITCCDNCSFIEDESFDINFWNVDDISLKKEKTELDEIVFLKMKQKGNWISSPFIVGKLS